MSPWGGCGVKCWALATLPVLPPPPSATLLLFSSQQWNWLVRALQISYTAHQAELEILGTLVNGVENLMASVQELQTALDRNTAATNAAGAAISTEVDQLKAAIAALSTNQPPTQAQLDQLSASSDALEAATATLVADDPAA